MRSRILFSCMVNIGIGIVCLLSSSGCHARKIKTTRSVKKTRTYGQQDMSTCDSVCSLDSYPYFADSIASKIRFYGFDKTISSSSESFFIVNGLNFDINGLNILITYLDMNGRMLHSREVSLEECDLPAGETRRFDLKSWDTQKSFYFHQSVKPRRQATPFDVKISLLSVRIPQ